MFYLLRKIIKLGVIITFACFCLIQVLNGLSFITNGLKPAISVFFGMQCEIFKVSPEKLSSSKLYDITFILVFVVFPLFTFLHSTTQVICSTSFTAFISTTVVFLNRNKLSFTAVIIIIAVATLIGFIIGFSLLVNEFHIFKGEGGFYTLNIIMAVIGGIFIALMTNYLYVLIRLIHKEKAFSDLNNLKKFISIGIQGNIIGLLLGAAFIVLSVKYIKSINKEMSMLKEKIDEKLRLIKENLGCEGCNLTEPDEKCSKWVMELRCFRELAPIEYTDEMLAKLTKIHEGIEKEKEEKEEEEELER